MAALTLPQIVQLYAPLLGLLGLAFWTGSLSERVKVAERTLKELREGEALGQAMRERIARFDERQDLMGKSVEKLERLMEGVQRQLANLANLNSGGIVELPTAGKRP